jgi:hypothetical protein
MTVHAAVARVLCTACQTGTATACCLQACRVAVLAFDHHAWCAVQPGTRCSTCKNCAAGRTTARTGGRTWSSGRASAGRRPGRSPTAGAARCGSVTPCHHSKRQPACCQPASCQHWRRGVCAVPVKMADQQGWSAVQQASHNTHPWTQALLCCSMTIYYHLLDTLRRRPVRNCRCCSRRRTSTSSVWTRWTPPGAPMSPPATPARCSAFAPLVKWWYASEFDACKYACLCMTLLYFGSASPYGSIRWLSACLPSCSRQQWRLQQLTC